MYNITHRVKTALPNFNINVHQSDIICPPILIWGEKEESIWPKTISSTNCGGVCLKLKQ